MCLAFGYGSKGFYNRLHKPVIQQYITIVTIMMLIGIGGFGLIVFLPVLLNTLIPTTTIITTDRSAHREEQMFDGG